MKPVYVATDYHEKQLQRALLQYNRPQNAPLVREALKKAGREERRLRRREEKSLSALARIVL